MDHELEMMNQLLHTLKDFGFRGRGDFSVVGYVTSLRYTLHRLGDDPQRLTHFVKPHLVTVEYVAVVAGGDIELELIVI